MPVLDEEFAKQVGAKDVDDVREKVKQSLYEFKQEQAEKEFKQQVLERVLEQAEVIPPVVMVQDELDRMQQEFVWRLEQQRMTLEVYLASQNKKIEDLRKEWEEQARKIVKLNIVLDEIAHKESISADEREIKQEVMYILERHKDTKGRLNPEGRRLRDKLDSRNGQLYLMATIRREKVKRWLWDKAEEKEKE
jgi:trigger factor